MMRSMYSGVAGLKTHQTRMDVIGNNIANVNTVAYKSQSMTFSELMYQTTQNASGANAETGRAGINARQIGLGVKTGAINTAITSQGASQTTNNPFDIRITGDAFFIVSNGMDNFFTRDGSFYVDGLGNLATTSNGYNVMGWQVDPETMDIKQDTVSPLRIMSAENMTYAPEATTRGRVTGIIDKNDTNVNSSSGKIMNFMFYDNLGYAYTAKFSIKSTDEDGAYAVALTDILDAQNRSLKEVYNVENITDIVTFGDTIQQVVAEQYDIYSAGGYEYDYSDPANPKFIHTMSNSKADFDKWLSDYSTKREVGVEYTFPTSGTFAADDPITAEGKITLTEDDLKKYGLQYQPDDNTYYYKDSATTDTSSDSKGKKVPAEMTWAEVFTKAGLFKNAKDTPALAVTNPDATNNGAVTVTFSQDFTVKSDIEIKGTEVVEELPADDINNKIKAYNLPADGNYTIDVAPDGTALVTTNKVTGGNLLTFDTDTGKFTGIGGKNINTAKLDFKAAATSLAGEQVPLENFADIDIDFSTTTMYNNSGTSTVSAASGDADKIGTGRKLGRMSGVSIQDDGRIYASYDNGMSRLLGQIAVAEFANASGLEKAGDNLYKNTQNSGDFDGIGIDIKSGGGYMTTGVLEMSNVDLSAEFTDMITTQRGFQANSRIITVSDTLLEELVNLKR